MISITHPADYSIKKLIKRGLQLAASRFGRHTRKPAEPELLLMMYHRILPAEDPRSRLEEPGMMITPETFHMQMELISSMFETIHLSDWLSRKADGKTLPLRCCAITFDDGWADNYEYAFPILQEFNIPATIYLVSDMVGKKLQFWPERLAQILTEIAGTQPAQWSHPSLGWIRDNGGNYDFSEIAPTSEQISEIIAGVKSLSDHVVHRRLDEIESQLGLSIKEGTPSLLNWSQIKTMCDSGLIETGSHTCRHTRLTAEKGNDVLQDEIINSKSAIEANTGASVNTFCFPNGDYSDTALSLVKQNYNGSVTTQRGWNTEKSDRYLLQRIGVHEDISNDRISFLSCISGWL